MMSFKLWLKCARASLKGQFWRPSNLYLMAANQVILASSALFAILVLFSRFKTLAGYSREEVLLLYGLAQASFALTEMTARGFDLFSGILARGEFDRILLRPRSTAFQVLCSRVELSKLGRFLVGSAVIAWVLKALWPAVASGGAALAVLKLLALFLMFSGSCAIFAGIFILGASLSFLSTDGLEIVNILSDGGREMAQYPLSIYERGFRRFFTFAVPFGCVNYLPLEFILGRPGTGPWAALLPLAGLAFLGLALLAWKAGTRRYASTGS